MSREIESARRRYLPESGIEILFIAESPPSDPSRFFYFEQVDEHDWLYLALMRALFADARGMDPQPLREQKPDYLTRFREAGYYLVDASDSPLPKGATRTEKRRRLMLSLNELIGKVRSLAGPHTRVVLISRTVFDVCSARLKAEGLQVINNEPIDFPANGRQPHFHRKMRQALQASDEHLQATIRGLEASIESFGAGEAKKRERERWIVEHFLRGLGIAFEPSEIEQPELDPPDAYFRGMAFEVKEIQEPGRQRGDEYRRALDRAKAAVSATDLLEQFTPQSLPIADAYRLVMDQSSNLAARKYVNAADRGAFHLLFYLNLGMALAWDAQDGIRPDLTPVIAGGWRSVSFLHGSGTVCVIFASDTAPAVVRAAQGRLISSDSIG